jgi:hypothetical protein
MEAREGQWRLIRSQTPTDCRGALQFLSGLEPCHLQ